jgi:hypothetical protein
MYFLIIVNVWGHGHNHLNHKYIHEVKPNIIMLNVLDEHIIRLPILLLVSFYKTYNEVHGNAFISYIKEVSYIK